MKRLLLASVALLGLIAPAIAQINAVPQVGVTTAYYQKQTFSAAFFGLVPVVTANTDQICISGSATKKITIQRITVWGTTATATQAVPINLVRRVSADTGGTAASTTANPANTIAKRDVSTGAATATLISYTAAPTVVDSSPTYLDSQMMGMPIVTSVMAPTPVDFHYARDTENLVQAPILVGTAAQVCVNNGAALTNASAWNGVVVWTEE